MKTRQSKNKVLSLLNKNPVVVLLGPRQVGKTTLALDIATQLDSIYIDLEKPRDLAKITDFEKFCQLNQDKMLILDEIQRMPELFPELRGIIDERRRLGKKTAQFLLLGSASIELLKQSSESLAGRIAQYELTPFSVIEVSNNQSYQLWNRGGFPESFLAKDDKNSLEWRQNFISTYLERDIPQLGPRIPAETLRRFWTMLAHNQGQTFNAASFARGLDVKGITASRYLDLMVDLLLVRRLQPWVSNQGKRLVKSPKTYIRDSGICHALLGIENTNELLGHPVVGGSWEGFILENIINTLPKHALFGYYRTVGGAEVDLVIELEGEIWAIEVKRSSAPKLSKGFHFACDDLKATQKIVIYSGHEIYPMSNGVKAVGVEYLMNQLI
jgi:predicted AAA+ superfamily ATPase